MIKELTKKQALRIRHYRKAGTWRNVARLAREDMPELKSDLSQYDGCVLCRMACEKLKQKITSSPWT